MKVQKQTNNDDKNHCSVNKIVNVTTIALNLLGSKDR